MAIHLNLGGDGITTVTLSFLTRGFDRGFLTGSVSLELTGGLEYGLECMFRRQVVDAAMDD
jgi:hypothetical protein